jgi:crotonobetainyl-CoA:carnitine CoA-transferase CaiB-like acyl-CoA transferase
MTGRRIGRGDQRGHLTGLYAAQALGVALYARERRGEGQRIEVSLAQCAAAILGHTLAEHVLEGGAPRQLNAPTGAYRTSDGCIMVALVREEQYLRLVGALSRPDLADDPRFTDFAARAVHSSVLADIVGQIIATDTTERWLERLRAADILVDRVNGFDDWLTDPHIVATGGAVSVEQPEMGQFPTPRTPGIPRGVEAALSPVLCIGEHGAAILAEIGIDPAAIARLGTENILLIPKAS